MRLTFGLAGRSGEAEEAAKASGVGKASGREAILEHN